MRLSVRATVRETVESWAIDFTLATFRSVPRRRRFGEAFAASGDVTDVHIVTDRESGQSRGFGFVTMGNAHEAANAIAAMNGAILDGRALRVNEAEERPQRSGGGGGFGGGGRSKNRW